MVNKLEELTNNKVKFIDHLKTRKLKSLFPLKDITKHKVILLKSELVLAMNPI